MEISQSKVSNSLLGNFYREEMKYSILVVDDESSGRTTIKILLEKHFWAFIESMTFAKTFDEAKERLQSHMYHMVFLDINLKGISSFNLLEFVPFNTTVVFVTAYSEFMIQALRNKAFDYLVKPIKEEELIECLQRFQHEPMNNSKEHVIHIKQRGLTRIIKTSDILYIQGDGPYSNIYLQDEHLTTAHTLKSFVPELGNLFVRIHKTYLVNRSYIKGFANNKVILLNNQSLPISRSGLKNI